MAYLHKLTLVALVVFFVGLGGCAGRAQVDDAPDTEPLRLGVQRWIGYGPWWVAKAQGLFDTNGLVVDLAEFESDRDLNNWFVQGKLDAISTSMHSAILLADQGVDFKIVLVLDASYTADGILAVTGIDRIEQLRGKRVAYEAMGTGDLLLTYALLHAGMRPQDVIPVPMSAPAAADALVKGQVDAAATYEPYISQARKAKPMLRLIFTAGQTPNLINDVLLVRSDVLSTRGRSIQRLVGSWDQAVDGIENDRIRAVNDLVGQWSESEATIIASLAGVNLFDLEDNRLLMKGPVFNSYTRLLGVMQAIQPGLNPPTARQIIDSQYLPEF